MTQLMFRALMVRATALLALAGCGLLGVMFWAQSRAEIEVARLFAALQPTFARAAHGPVVVNIWDRSVLIPDLVLVRHGAINAAATTVASVEVRDVSRGGGLIHAGQIVIKGLQSWGGPIVVHRSTLTADYDVPELTLENVTFDRVASTWFGAISARSVRASQVTGSAVYSPTALSVGGSGSFEHVLSTVTIGDIRNGKIGVMTAEKIALVGTQAGANTAAFAAEIHDAALSDFDLAVVTSVLQAASMTPSAAPASAPFEPSDANGTKTIFRFVASGPVTLKRDGMTTALANAEWSNIGLDTGRTVVALRKLKSSQPAPGERATRKQEQLSADARSALQDSMALDHLRVRDLNVIGPAGWRMKLASLQLNDLRHSRLANLSVADMSVSGPEAGSANETVDRVSVAALAVQGFSVFEASQLPDMLPGHLGSGLRDEVVTSAVRWPSIIRLFTAIEVKDFAMLRAGQREGLIVDQFDTSFGPIIGQTPTSGRLKAQFSLPTPTPTGTISDAAPMTWLTRHGMRRAYLRIDGTWNWQEAAKALLLGPVDVAVADVGHATAKLRLGNVSRQALIARPELMPAAIQAITLGPAELTLRDLGLLKGVGADAAVDAERRQFIARIRAQARALSNPKRTGETLIGTAEPAAPPLMDLLDGIARFLANPGRELAVTVTPITPINIASLLASRTSGTELMLMLSRQIDARASVR